MLGWALRCRLLGRWPLLLRRWGWALAWRLLMCGMVIGGALRSVRLRRSRALRLTPGVLWSCLWRRPLWGCLRLTGALLRLLYARPTRRGVIRWVRYRNAGHRPYIMVGCNRLTDNRIGGASFVDVCELGAIRAGRTLNLNLGRHRRGVRLTQGR